MPRTKKVVIPVVKYGKVDTFKRTIAWFKKYKAVLFFSIIFGIISTLLNSAVPIIGAYLLEKINAMPASDDVQKVFSEVLWLGMILIFAYLLSFAFQITSIMVNIVVGQKVSRKVRNDLVVKLNTLPLIYYDKNAVGDTMNIICGNSFAISHCITTNVANIINNSIQSVAVLIGMILISWQMSAASIALLLIAAVFIVFFLRLVGKYNHQLMKANGKMSGVVEETFSGIEIVKNFNLEKHYNKKFDERNAELNKLEKKCGVINNINSIVLNFIINAVLIALATVAGFLALKFGDPSLVLIYPSYVIFINFLAGPITSISSDLSSLQNYMAQSNRVYSLTEAEEQKVDYKFPNKIKKVAGAIEFKNVSFSYVENTPIINNFSIKIKPGQKVAIVGPTGAGKTTIINLLMRFYDPKKGSILIDGVDIKTLKRTAVHALFGMVLQDTWVFKDTIANNLIYTKKNVTREEMERVCKLTNIDHFVKTLPKQYDTIIDNAVSISDGEKQLLTITRAMIQNAPIVILDEATSGIDTRLEIIVQTAMDKLLKGRTSFVIAHRLSTIKNADIILVMNNGNIVEHGNHETLLSKNGFYAKLYNSQFNM
ncbi:MAG: ABC transporter ATP-binding protein/permease [Mycoplasmataceae bacterium]|nr:ABC transporter ATP-binding protein/permease [Mycoplasmataceae bacterium]